MIITNKKYNNIRLDRFLREEGVPQSLISKFCRKRLLKVNKKRVAISERINIGDEICIPNTDMQRLYRADFELDVEVFKQMIIAEENEWIAINKPPGLACQRGIKINESVDEYLRTFNPEGRLVHRIDKETSGILICALTREFAQEISKLFANGEVQKEYYAVLEGVLPDNTGVIDQAIEKHTSYKIMVPSEGGLRAVTEYETVDVKGDLSLVKFKPKTGRTHQLRCHSKYMDCPILGDEKYNHRTNSGNLHLFAKRIIVEKLGIDIEIDLPDWFKAHFAAS